MGVFILAKISLFANSLPPPQSSYPFPFNFLPSSSHSLVPYFPDLFLSFLSLSFFHLLLILYIHLLSDPMAQWLSLGRV